MQVLDRSGRFIRVFGEEKLSVPKALHIIFVDKYAYVPNDFKYVVVCDTSGQFVTSFRELGLNE